MLVPDLETSLIAERAQICHETLGLNGAGKGLGRFTHTLRLGDEESGWKGLCRTQVLFCLRKLVFNHFRTVKGS